MILHVNLLVSNTVQKASVLLESDHHRCKQCGKLDAWSFRTRDSLGTATSYGIMQWRSSVAVVKVKAGYIVINKYKHIKQ